MIVGPVSGFVPRPYQEWCINGGAPDLGIGIMPAFARYRRVLVEMATGCGKTETFLALTRRFLDSPKTPTDKRVLILAHRDELVSQPIERSTRFGMRFAREQGKASGAGKMERVVASTVQSMSKRLDKYSPDEFGLVIIDECHHSPANDYVKILDHFASARVLGVSATPERLDGVALGEVFEAVAFSYGIEAATADGWLVPVKPLEITVDGLDISKLRARAGDLPPGPLGELLAEYAMPVAKHIIEKAGDRPTIIFCATMAHAHAQAAALRRELEVRGIDARVESADGFTDKDNSRCRYRATSSCFAGDLASCSQSDDGAALEVSEPGLDTTCDAAPASCSLHSKPGKRKQDRSKIRDGSPLQWEVLDRLQISEAELVGEFYEAAERLVAQGYISRVSSIDASRADIVADFRAGKVRYLCNAYLFVEGFDAPNARCVALVRPTKSRSMVIQAVGRGTRPEPGCVDKASLRDDPDGRRAAIAASSKPDLLVLDFCAQVEGHGLTSAADALAGKLSPEERLMLGKLDIVGEKTIDALTAEARRLAAEEAVRLAALSAAEATSREVDPFNPAKVLSLKDMPRNDPNEARCSEKMAKHLASKGIAAAEALSVSQAKKINGALAMRAERHLCTYKQALALQKAGVPVATTTRMYYSTASNLITGLTMNGWRRPKDWDANPVLGGRAPARAMIVPPLEVPRAG